MSFRRNNFKLAYRSLKAAKGRSFLTMLGVIIGVMAVVLVVCIGQGIKEQIAGQLGRYGKAVFTVLPGSPNSTLSTLGGLSTTSSALLTEHDLSVVQKTKGVTAAVPLATATGSATGDHTVQSPFVVATNANFPDVIHQDMVAGGFFDDDVNSQGVVLGPTIAQKLFNDNAPLGQSLVWHGQHFVVAGVFDDFHAPPFSLEANFNNAIFVPFGAAQNISGSVLGIYQIVGKAASAGAADQTIKNVTAALVTVHGGAQDVTVSRAAQSNLASDQALHLLTMLVVGAAIIALIVSGVGIMDVMLVSITERMHEIGLRKAIGATNRQIMRQFMAEAFVLSSGGAVIGLVLACITVGLLRAYSSVEAVLVWQILVIAPVVAVAIGLFFGSLPALKAARKDPIDALRHE